MLSPKHQAPTDAPTDAFYAVAAGIITAVILLILFYA
jgi:hypothetical protein